jgi:hypothetical protein
MDFAVIDVYSLDDAVADGILVPLIPEYWETLTGGIPIVVTAALHERFSEEQLTGVYNRYVHWFHHIRETLPDEDQMYSETLEGEKVWVIFDGAAVTILFPRDY